MQASMRKLLLKTLLFGLLSLLFFGCGLSERPYPLVRTYTLDLPSENLGSQRKNPQAVLMITASPPPAAYDSQKLVYKLKAHELSPDYYNEFYTPPGRAIADSIATYLDLNSPKLQIVRYQGASSPDYSLEVGLVDFYGDYSVNPPVLRLTLTITLNDLRRASPKILFTSRYTKTPPLVANAGEDRPETLVRHMIESLQEIYPQVLSDVESQLKIRR
jgi:hypothetical protein